MPALKAEELLTEEQAEPSHIVAGRVIQARKRQQERHQQKLLNAVIDGDQLKKIAEPDQDGKELLNKAIDKMRLSARSYHRILKVSRTIADLEESETVHRHHIAEALSYRQNIN